jgi:hypothetical protein
MKMVVNGVEKEVERVRIVNSGEPWGEHLLEDGHVLRVRLIVTAAFKVVGETDPAGNPLYNIQTQMAVSVE